MNGRRERPATPPPALLGDPAGHRETRETMLTEQSRPLSMDERLRITRELEATLVDFWYDVDTNWGRRAGEFYTEDGVFEASEQTYRGRARIEEFYRYRLGRGPRVAAHTVSNFRAVPESPNAATSTWYLILYAQDGAPILPTAPPIQIALATDRCVRCEDGRWRYKHRKFEVWFKGGVPTTTLKD
jgi:hypothetical protein